MHHQNNTNIQASLVNDANESGRSINHFNFFSPQQGLSQSAGLTGKTPQGSPLVANKAGRSRRPGSHTSLNNIATRGTRSQIQHSSRRPGSTQSPITRQKSKPRKNSSSREITLQKLLSTYISSPSFRGLRQLHHEAMIYGEEFGYEDDARSTSDISSSFHSLATSELSDKDSETDVTSISSTPRQKNVDAHSLNESDTISADERSQTASDSKPQYPCTLEGCNKISHNASEFQRHEKNKGHYNPERYMCVSCLCPDYLTGDAICQLCDSPFTMHESLEAHYRRCLPTLKTQPTRATFTRSYHTTKHLVEKHGYTRVDANGFLPSCIYLLDDGWPRECKICDETFDTFEERNKHILWHYKRGDTWPKSNHGPGNDSDDDDDNDNDHDDGKHSRKKTKPLFKACAKSTKTSSSITSQDNSTSSSQSFQTRDASPVSSDESGYLFAVGTDTCKKSKHEKDIVKGATSNLVEPFEGTEPPTVSKAETSWLNATEQLNDFDTASIENHENVSNDANESTSFSTADITVPVIVGAGIFTERQATENSTSLSASSRLYGLSRAQIKFPDQSKSSFIPIKEIKRLMTAKMVKHELLLYSTQDNVCFSKSAARLACDIEKRFSKLFAILVTIGKGSSIESFMREHISDKHLPFIRSSGLDTNCYSLYSKLNPDVSISCMSDWNQEAIAAFDREQQVFGYSLAEHCSHILLDLTEPTGVDSSNSRHRSLDDDGLSYQMRRFLKEGDDRHSYDMISYGDNDMESRSSPPAPFNPMPVGRSTLASVRSKPRSWERSGKTENHEKPTNQESATTKFQCTLCPKSFTRIHKEWVSHMDSAASMNDIPAIVSAGRVADPITGMAEFAKALLSVHTISSSKLYTVGRHADIKPDNILVHLGGGLVKRLLQRCETETKLSFERIQFNEKSASTPERPYTRLWDPSTPERIGQEAQYAVSRRLLGVDNRSLSTRRRNPGYDSESAHCSWTFPKEYVHSTMPVPRETQLESSARTHLLMKFDLISGTSTGVLLALSLLEKDRIDLLCHGRIYHEITESFRSRKLDFQHLKQLLKSPTNTSCFHSPPNPSCDGIPYIAQSRANHPYTTISN
jgi:hypothetical protein